MVLLSPFIQSLTKPSQSLQLQKHLWRLGTGLGCSKSAVTHPASSLKQNILHARICKGKKKSVKRLYFLTCHCIAQAFRGRSFYEPFSGYPSTSRLTRNKHGSPPSPGCAKSLCDLTSSSQINCSPILTPAFRRCIGCWKIRMHSEPET